MPRITLLILVLLCAFDLHAQDISKQPRFTLSIVGGKDEISSVFCSWNTNGQIDSFAIASVPAFPENRTNTTARLDFDWSKGAAISWGSAIRAHRVTHSGQVFLADDGSIHVAALKTKIQKEVLLQRIDKASPDQLRSRTYVLETLLKE